MKKILPGNTVDISDLASGVYTIFLESRIEVVKKRFVKH